MMKTFRAFRLAVIVCLLVFGLVGVRVGVAQQPVASGPAKPADALREYRSQGLHVRTDLSGEQADALFARLETTLRQAETYWRRPPRGQIECYVVDDLAKWSDDQLPHRLARVIVAGVGGATIPRGVGSGKRTRNCPTVFACSELGVAEHELVHAYCVQTFGSAGPGWYKEGMAEMVVRQCTRESGVVCTSGQIKSIRGDRPVSVRDVLSGGDSGTQIFASLNKKFNDPKHRAHHVPLSEWTEQDGGHVAAARRDNLRSWAFCYMLMHNPNYSQRFRMLGRNLVLQRRTDFEEFFAAVEHRLAFEYAFFLQHLDVGFRVDLCHWDWDKRFRVPEVGETVSVRINAARGFQASGIELVAGQKYGFQADGSWFTASALASDADGAVGGVGRLVGAILSEGTIGEEFPLGRRGDFTAPVSGRLYLRCRDSWNALSNNHGEILVKLSSQ